MNNDLISREALKKAIDKYAQMTNENVKFSYNAILAIIDNAPTIETSYDLYREETCERKAHCYDYKYWHCIGCHGCKAEIKEADND